jgi:hypothetical protein
MAAQPVLLLQGSQSRLVHRQAARYAPELGLSGMILYNRGGVKFGC